ncbi:hypothetical protein HK104_011459 [Borealophlyctis nickersoniae]|nr:hypothetical protein HK104_011459 [Borealophlyctis nickersoniae]
MAAQASPATSPLGASNSLPPPQRLELELIPGAAAGPFRLGAAVGDVIKVLQDREPEIPKVEFMFSDMEPLSVDLVLNLPRNGVCLRFDPRSQRLKLIELYDFAKLWLLYQGNDFNSAKNLPTFLLIYKIFGPTYPGVYDEKQSRYIFRYPGITFIFPVPPQYVHLPTKSTDLPLSFPDGTTPVVNRIYIYAGDSHQKAAAPSEPLRPSDLYFEQVSIMIGESVTFSRRGCSIAFGAPTQDVLAELGRPAHVMFKEDDKMRIHTAVVNGGSYGNVV